MTGSGVGLAAALAARRTACAFLREACAPATWVGVGLAAADALASLTSLCLREHWKQCE